MVNHGPSRACAVCRKQRIKCDLGRPSCGYCLRKGIRCPGIKRGPTEYEFKGETLSVTQSFGRGSKLFKASTGSANSPASSITYSSSSSTRSTTDAVPHTPATDDLASQQVVRICKTPTGSAYDPFGAFSVCIDSHTHELLSFWHGYLWRPSCERGQTTLKLFHNAWDLALHCLWAESDVYSFLAAAADFYTASTKSKRMSMLAPKWRVKALGNLRMNIDDGNIAPHLGAILRLLAGDLAAANYLASLHHAKLLATLFDPQSSGFRHLPKAAKHAFFWQETHRATATFTRPMIDLNHEALNESLPLDPDSGLDCAALVDPTLVHLFIELRRYLNILNDVREDDIQPSRLELSTQLLLLGGKLIDYSVVSADRSQSTTTPIEAFRSRQCAAASLAALYWLRLMTRMETASDSIGGPPIMVSSWPQGPRIADRMQELLAAGGEIFVQPVIQPESTPAALLPETRLRVWVLEVGSIIERTSLQHRAHRPYHQEEQQRLLLSSGIWERPEFYEEILSGFIPLNTARIRTPAWLTPSIRTWGLRE